MKQKVFRALALLACIPCLAHAAVSPAILSLSRTGSTVSGTLTAKSGSPIANATVTLSTVDVGARLGLVNHTVSGTVPSTATSAVVGLRVGVDGATVSSAAGVVVGGLSYDEPGDGREESVSTVADPIAGAPLSYRTLSLVPGQTLNQTLGTLTVKAGEAFVFGTPMMATSNAAQAGYAFISFLNKSGATLSTYEVWFTPTQQTLGTVTTSSSGKFSLSLAAHVNLADPEILASYAGSSSAGAASATQAPLGLNAINPMPPLQQPLSGSGTGSAPQVWLQPEDDFLTDLNSEGWASLLPQWSTAASHTKVMQFTTGLLFTLPTDFLAQLVANLNANGIALGLQIDANNWYGEPSCGSGIESYTDPATVNDLVVELMAAGANLAVVTMDEPLYYGHYYTGSGSCQSSLANSAQRVAETLRIYKAAFPNLIIGDTEPFPLVSDVTTWPSDYATWLSGITAATGYKIAFMNMDIDWDQAYLLEPPTYEVIPNPTTISQMVNYVATTVRADGLNLGTIVNGNGSATTAAAWMWEGEAHVLCLQESDVAPQLLVFESWASEPTLTVPETNANALTYLLDYWFTQ